MAGLAAVSEAAGRGEWQRALDLLDGCGHEMSSAAGLELRAQASYGAGDFEGSVSAWEALHTLRVEEHDPAGAAFAAATVAMFLLIDTGLMAAVRGWVRRAERHLDGHPEVPAHAVIAVVRGYERFMCGDVEGAREHSARAIDSGTRHGVIPAVIIGRVCAARIRIFDGAVDEGIELLDDIAIDLMSGTIDPITTGMMYCELICAAQGMALHDRVVEWTEVMDRWSRRSAVGSVRGRCRVHRAEILRMSGTCDEAEREALGACEELRPWMRREFGWPLVELGNIRLRRGDLAGAEEAFIAAHEHAWSPQPGLALLRLAQGDTPTAAAMIADAIVHPFDTPSKERPPFGELRLAPLLEAQVEIAAAAGDLSTLRAATLALSTIAESYPSRSLAAGTALAHARLHLVDSDAEGAIGCAVNAMSEWTSIGAPFDAAVARMVLGDARLLTGDVEGARLEWRTARSAFVGFGAVLWAERAEQLAEGTMPDPAPSATGGRAVATFRCDGDTRTIQFGDHRVLMRDLQGFRYIARLLADPGREFHVLDLIAVEHGTLPAARTGARSSTRSSAHDDDLTADGLGAGLPMLDDQAREAYRRRLADVEDDIEDAERMNDLGRAELAQRDRDYLIAELSRAVGLGHRPRTTGSTGERARTSVTRSFRYALERLSEHHPALATHLRQGIQTGTYCRYTVDPTAPLDWDL
jgi:tetratricopeptide (TPR) repeat protein